MDQKLREIVNNLSSSDNAIRLDAYNHIMDLTAHMVPWVYEIWDELVEKLHSDNSFQRSIGVMVLCNLAKSDSENRLENILDTLLLHTRDEKFITSRQTIQNIWKAGLRNPKLKSKIVTRLTNRYRECEGEKHYNLIRQDIIQSLRSLSESDDDPDLFSLAECLVEEEEEIKFRKKYQQLLKG
jgi:uncharacterized membrane-anchored protein YjiN (DUF445 family)